VTDLAILDVAAYVVRPVGKVPLFVQGIANSRDR
jgi:hypothetical protein